MSAKTAEKSKSSDVSRSNEEQENRVKTDTPLKFSRYDCAVITVVITTLLLWATLLLATKVSFLNKQVIIMYIAPLSVVSLYFNYNIMSIRDIIFICGGLYAISLIYVLIFMFKHDNIRFKILKFIALTWAWISFVVIAIIIGVIIHCLRDNAEYSRENNAKRAALDVISRALKNR